MSFYNDPESVKQYIKMCEGYDGSNIYQQLGHHLPQNSTLLELGSGAGLDIDFLKKNYSVTGSDLSYEFLKICRQQHPELSFVKLDALKLNLDEQFNCIYSNKVLHHLTEVELKESLRQQLEILSPNGLIAHSFWLGEESKTMHDLLFIYYDKAHLLDIISEFFDVLSTLSYEELSQDDSLFVIAKKP